MNAPVTWFEVATADPEGAKAFYSELFGWSFAADEGTPEYSIINTGVVDAIGGGLFATKGEMPSYSVFCVQVADVTATCTQAESLGGKVLVEPVTMDNGLSYAHLLDRDGLHFGVFCPPAA
jgi:predicted enzyme related to lactoylglutathione lyase